MISDFKLLQWKYLYALVYVVTPEWQWIYRAVRWAVWVDRL